MVEEVFLEGGSVDTDLLTSILINTLQPGSSGLVEPDPGKDWVDDASESVSGDEGSKSSNHQEGGSFDGEDHADWGLNALAAGGGLDESSINDIPHLAGGIERNQDDSEGPELPNTNECQLPVSESVSFLRSTSIVDVVSE